MTLEVHFKRVCLTNCFLSLYFRSPDDSSKLKQKMLYASSKEAVKRAFEGVAKHVQCNDTDELCFDTIVGTL